MMKKGMWLTNMSFLWLFWYENLYLSTYTRQYIECIYMTRIGLRGGIKVDSK